MKQHIVRQNIIKQNLVLLLLLLCSASPYANAQVMINIDGNIVSNGDFEQELTGWDAWSNPVVTDTDVSSGAVAIELVNQGSISQWIDVEASTTYTLSAYVKISDSPNM